MGNFEKLSVLVIVVIIVMILVVALYTWTDNPDSAPKGGTEVTQVDPAVPPPGGTVLTPVIPPSTLPPAPVPGPLAKPATPAPGPGNNRSITELLTLTGAKPDDGISPVPPPAVPEAPKPTEPRIHAVQQGETLSGIAKTYFPGRAQKGLLAIEAANPGIDSTRLRVGQKVTIPDLGAAPEGGAKPVVSNADAPKPTASIERGGWYVTKRGDTLPGISRRAYLTTERWPEIWIENMDALGQNTDRLEPGIRIRIPR